MPDTVAQPQIELMGTGTSFFTMLTKAASGLDRLVTKADNAGNKLTKALETAAKRGDASMERLNKSLDSIAKHGDSAANNLVGPLNRLEGSLNTVLTACNNVASGVVKVAGALDTMAASAAAANTEIKAVTKSMDAATRSSNSLGGSLGRASTGFDGLGTSSSKTLNALAIAVAKAETLVNNLTTSVTNLRSAAATPIVLNVARGAGGGGGGAASTPAIAGLSAVGAGLSAAGSQLTSNLTIPGIGAIAASVAASVSRENSLADIVKLFPEATAKQVSDLNLQMVQLTHTLPVAYKQLASIGSMGANLGVPLEQMGRFMKVTAELGETAGISGEAAATGLAKIAAATGVADKDFGDFIEHTGSALSRMSKMGAASTPQILKLTEQFASTGKLAKMNVPDMFALANAIASMGQESEAGASAMQRIIKLMAVATATGGQQLDNFGRVSGMSAKQFKDLFNKDGFEAIMSYVRGLAALDKQGHGGNSIKALNDMGITDVRLFTSIQNLANGYAKARELRKQSNEGAEQNNDLTVATGIKVATAGSQFKILWNEVEETGKALGDDLVPALRQTLPAVKDILGDIRVMADAFAKLPKPVQETAFALGGIALAAGPVMSFFGGIASGAAGFMKVAQNIGPILTVLRSVAGPIGIIIAALTLLVIAWTRDWGHIQEVVQSFITWIQPYIEKFTTWWEGAWSKLTTKLSKFWDEIAPRVEKALGPALQKLQTFMALAEGIIRIESPVVVGLFGTLWEAVKGIFITGLDAILNLLRMTLDLMNGDYKKFGTDFKAFTHDLTDDVVHTWANMWEALSGGFKSSLDEMKAYWAGFLTTIKGGGSIQDAMTAGNSAAKLMSSWKGDDNEKTGGATGLTGYHAMYHGATDPSQLQNATFGGSEPVTVAEGRKLGSRFGFSDIGGKRKTAVDPDGHPKGLALDFMIHGDTQKGYALAKYAAENMAEEHVKYVIYRQHIISRDRYNEGWRKMEDRGNPTANHMDHVHITFDPNNDDGGLGGRAKMPSGKVKGKGGGFASLPAEKPDEDSAIAIRMKRINDYLSGKKDLATSKTEIAQKLADTQAAIEALGEDKHTEKIDLLKAKIAAIGQSMDVTAASSIKATKDLHDHTKALQLLHDQLNENLAAQNAYYNAHAKLNPKTNRHEFTTEAEQSHYWALLDEGRKLKQHATTSTGHYDLVVTNIEAASTAQAGFRKQINDTVLAIQNEQDAIAKANETYLKSQESAGRAVDRAYRSSLPGGDVQDRLDAISQEADAKRATLSPTVIPGTTFVSNASMDEYKRLVNEVNQWETNQRQKVLEENDRNTRNEQLGLQKFMLNTGQETLEQYRDNLTGILTDLMTKYKETGYASQALGNDIQSLADSLIHLGWQEVGNEMDSLQQSLADGDINAKQYVEDLRRLMSLPGVDQSPEYKKGQHAITEAQNAQNRAQQAQADKIGEQGADIIMGMVKHTEPLKVAIRNAMMQAGEDALKAQVKRLVSDQALKIIKDRHPALEPVKSTTDKLAEVQTGLQTFIDKWQGGITQLNTIMTDLKKVLMEVASRLEKGSAAGDGSTIPAPVATGSSKAPDAGTLPSTTAPVLSNGSYGPKSDVVKANKAIAQADTAVDAAKTAESLKSGKGGILGAANDVTGITKDAASLGAKGLDKFLGSVAPVLGVIGGVMALASLFGGSGKKTPTSIHDQTYRNALTDFGATIDSGYSGPDGLRNLLGQTSMAAAGVTGNQRSVGGAQTSNSVVHNHNWGNIVINAAPAQTGQKIAKDFMRAIEHEVGFGLMIDTASRTPGT